MTKTEALKFSKQFQFQDDTSSINSYVYTCYVDYHWRRPYATLQPYAPLGAIRNDDDHHVLYKVHALLGLRLIFPGL